MSNKLFFSQNVVLGVITRKSTTSKFNNLLLNQHFSFPFSLKCNTTTSESESESITQPFAVSYLINNFGFSTESALKAFNLKQVRFNAPDKPDSVITFFENHGFSHENIRIIIKKAPWLLSSQPHNVILPKLQFFLSKGASSSDIVSLFTSNPQILQSSLEKRIIPHFELLIRFLKTNKDTIVYLIRHSKFFIIYPHHLIVANINLMSDFGVSDSHIASMLQSRPSMFGSKDLIKSLEEVKGLGFDPSLTTFGTALMTKQCMSKKLWDEKVDVFKKWGWSDEDVIRVFRSQPNLMLTSIEKINLVMSFWVNQMGWDPLPLTKCPLMFAYSLPKRIIPRASVLQFLLMKGLRKKNASLVTPFIYSEKLFLSKFVFSFEEESDYLLKLYEEKVKLANTTENNGMPSTKSVISRISSMKTVELRRDVSRRIEFTTPSEEISEEVPEILKYGLKDSLISKFLVKPNQININRMILEEPEMVRFMDSVQTDLLMQKIKQDAMEAKIMDLVETQKELSAKQEEMAKKQDEILKHQTEMKSGIQAILEMMQKQHQPSQP